MILWVKPLTYFWRNRFDAMFLEDIDNLAHGELNPLNQSC